MKSRQFTWPEAAEGAMLGVIVQDMLSAADRNGHAEYRFRKYRVTTNRLGKRHRFQVQTADSTIPELDARK
ncbi:hypothetical protein Nhal_3979 (plasmid) [Nitrosococcus halophilus Nc 4]|uniref:Uncharacterized protein n=1 Tax=Nitrosococcus halophilus (strain Nc4) TaxID=472759 RepID=D5C5D4_NITHN|nr:hypothetical protein [Nitrosococcus halophilus]ADE16988.1 hypothetical protein Nhal_3979 [Nitrosococcus halophilus Nc 4]